MTEFGVDYLGSRSVVFGVVTGFKKRLIDERDEWERKDIRTEDLWECGYFPVRELEAGGMVKGEGSRASFMSRRI